MTDDAPTALEYRLFADREGEEFLLRSADATVRLRLVEAKAVPAQGQLPESVRSEPFSLLFEVEGGDAVEQGLYRVEHAVLGGIDIFLVPVGPGRNEAVFY